MNDEKVRRFHGERGATLILAIAFMVVVGSISAAVLATTTSGLQDRVTLDQARNREYAADAGIEQSVVAARALSGICAPPPSSPYQLNNVSIHVDCSAVQAVAAGANGILRAQTDLSFVACVATGNGYGLPCSPTQSIITAQVNFQGTAPAVTTFVQAWSVNG